jgi:2-polyprenyl-6-methoxyphenol hydroxylase-like FAD-dependent oxidoreductase
VDFRFDCPVQSVDVHTGTLTYESPGDGAATQQFDLVIGADGAGP